MTIRWRLIITCAVFFLFWYIGPGVFEYFTPGCDPTRLETCE